MYENNESVFKALNTLQGTVINGKYEELKGITSANAGVGVKDAGSNCGSVGNQAKGGAGTINVGEIRNGQYYDLKEIIQQDIDTYTETVTKSGDSIIDILNKYPNLTTGYHNFRVTANGETISYSVHLIVLEGDQVITEDTKYGDAQDCATGETFDKLAKNLVIVKVNGNYTINENVTVGPYYDATYGGPKGFML